jgi:phosphatidylserine decarboxylase
MAKTLQEWLDFDVGMYRDKPTDWLSQYFFFRDPPRPTYVDSSYFFAPADGAVLYQRVIAPDSPLVSLKGRHCSLREALRDSTFNTTCLVTGIFMTFYDVHVNRVPYSGRLSYRLLEPIDTYNHPMLDVEHSLLENLGFTEDSASYLYSNQRLVNRFDVMPMRQSYYVLQIADYDVDSITPFELQQNRPMAQGRRFSQIRYGSQVDLIIPLSDRYDLVPLQREGLHIEAGVDPVVAIREA